MFAENYKASFVTFLKFCNNYFLVAACGWFSKKEINILRNLLKEHRKVFSKSLQNGGSSLSKKDTGWKRESLLKTNIFCKAFPKKSTVQKIKFFIKDFSVNVTKSAGNCTNLQVTFTKKILDGRLHFLWSRHFSWNKRLIGN